MIRVWKFLPVGAAFTFLIVMVWYGVAPQDHATPEITAQIEACDSCKARHQNLTRMRAVRSPLEKPDQ